MRDDKLDLMDLRKELETRRDEASADHELKGVVPALDRAIDVIERERRALTRKRHRHSEEERRRREDKIARDAEVKRLREDIERLKGERERLTGELAEAHREVAEQKRVMEGEAADKDDLKSQLAEAREKHEALSADLQKANAGRDAASKRAEENGERLRRALGNVTDLKIELDALRQGGEGAKPEAAEEE